MAAIVTRHYARPAARRQMWAGLLIVAGAVVQVATQTAHWFAG